MTVATRQNSSSGLIYTNIKTSLFTSFLTCCIWELTDQQIVDVMLVDSMAL